MKIPDLNVELIYSEGKPKRAIIDLEALEALLDAAEDLDDIQALDELKNQELEFVTLDELMNARHEQESVDRQSAASDPMENADVHGSSRKAGFRNALSPRVRENFRPGV